MSCRPSTAPGQLTNKAHKLGISRKKLLCADREYEGKCIQYIKIVTMWLVTAHNVFETRDDCDKVRQHSNHVLVTSILDVHRHADFSNSVRLPSVLHQDPVC